METMKMDVGETPTVQIQHIGGDLRISGKKDAQFEAQAADGDTLNVAAQDDQVMVNCRSDCLIFLPTGANIEVEKIGGDARFTGLTQDIGIHSIGGDLSLRRVGQTTIGTIGGDLFARKVGANLAVERIGGDAVIERVDGEVRLQSVGGDLIMNKVSGLIEAVVGGDALLRISPNPGTDSQVKAGGDLSCRLPEDVSASITLRAGGDMGIPAEVEKVTANGTTTIQLGEGEATIDLSAGGDLWLRVGKREMGYEEDLVGSVMGELDGRLAEMEARFNAIGAGIYAFDAERIGERVRRSVAKAQRRAAKARARAEKVASGFKGGRTITFGLPESKTTGVSDDERLAVLRMLEQGKISVDEAEKLLKALGGEF
jgi:hypothetical protein